MGTRQHDNSCDCTKSELDLFAVPPTQTSIQEGSWESFHPIATLGDQSPIEFSVPDDGEQYIDLANVQLYLTAKIIKADGGTLAATDYPGPVNNWLHSLFEQVDVSLGDTVISSPSNTYPYRAYLETLLSLSDETKKTQQTTSLWYKDYAGKFDGASCQDGGDRNQGLIKRGTFTAKSKTVEMVGRLHCDIFSQERFLINKVPLRLRLIRSRDAFSLMNASDTLKCKVNIVSAVLMVRRVQLSPSVFMAHQKAIRNGPAKYPIKRVLCKYFSIPQGNTSTNLENLFQGQMPTRIIIGCVDSDAFNGSFTKSPFNFKHKNLSQVALRVAGLKDPIKPLTPVFPDQYLLSYLSLLTGTGKWGKNEGCHFNRDEYAKGYCLFAWDLTADLADGGDHFQLMRTTSVRLELKFKTAVTDPTNVIVYAEFENMIIIDADRNVTTNFTM